MIFRITNDACYLSGRPAPTRIVSGSDLHELNKLWYFFGVTPKDQPFTWAYFLANPAQYREHRDGSCSGTVDYFVELPTPQPKKEKK